MSEAIPNDAGAANQDPFQAAKASAMRAAEELRNSVTQKAQELRSVAQERAQQIKQVAQDRADDIRDYADQAFTQAKDRYADLRTESEKMIRDKPVQAVLTAFGVGLVLGLILRR